jgi:hypothetical protein
VARWAFVAFVVVLLPIAACGRSNLDDDLTDGGYSADVNVDAPDGGTCNPTTCPTGCCDGNGVCQAGNTMAACGTLGETCQNCTALGFQFCDATRQACGSSPGQCNGQTCPTGCCEGNTCFAGIDPNECGQAGQTCRHCQQAGLQCQGHQCVQGACGPQNCKGCCFGDQCLSGTDQTACGIAGQQCQNCVANGQQCIAQGGPVGGTCQGTPQCNPSNCKGCCNGNACVPGNDNGACGIGGVACANCTVQNEVCNGAGQCVNIPPKCGPFNCANGCCHGNTCVPGSSDNQCGNGGALCQDCTQNGDVCQKPHCVPPHCDSNNCPGCCDQNLKCQPGFLNTQCGQFGASCQNCTQQKSFCDTQVTPRVCQSQQTQCPSPYATCPNNVTTPVPTVQKGVCPGNDLVNAGAACTGGAHTSSCNSFFQFEQQQHPACATCLTPFHADFQELVGLFECVAPFVSSSCNHSTGCVVDCEDTSCSQCQPQDVAQCQQTALQGQCQPYLQQAACVLAGFLGQGAFCNPNSPQYQGNYGRWLQGVGTHYCGP